jgi:hypothetical protein
MMSSIEVLLKIDEENKSKQIIFNKLNSRKS